MKQLLIIALVLGTIAVKASAGECNITLKAKSASAKGGKLDGVSFTKKHIKALKKIGCAVSVKMMSKEELIADFEKNLDKRIAKAALELKEDQAE